MQVEIENLLKKTDCILFNSQNQYLESDNILLQKIANFTGSNGILLMMRGKNIFITDGRYILQAKKEIKIKCEIIDQSKISLIDILKQNSMKKISMIFANHSQKYIVNLKKDFKLINIKNFSKKKSKKQQIFSLHIKYSGEFHLDKIKRLQKIIKNEDFLITDSSCISWLLNIRAENGHNMYCKCIAIVKKNGEVKIFGDFQNTITIKNVKFYKMNDFLKHFAEINSILLDENEINADLFLQISQKTEIINIKNPIPQMKAIKNDIEIDGFKKAHEIEVVVFNKLISFVKENKKNLTEYSISEEILKIRGQKKEFIHNSFETISAFNENSAIIHYRPTSKNSKIIKNDGILLIDTGGHYKFGTTDATRVIKIGNLEKIFPEIKKHYTIVYKALHKILEQHFPIGTKSYQLDAIARGILWNYGLDYPHGTSHGIGHCLSVHEFPPSVSKNSDIILEKNMIMSVEPGLYLDRLYGIRLENVVVIKESNKYKNFLMLENLTKIPFEEDLIDYNLLKNL